MSQSIDTSVLDALISGRVVPHIYAFKTSEKHYPQYLKVGDTYRPVERRLKEWEVHFEGLKEVFRCKAVIDGTDVYFYGFRRRCKIRIQHYVIIHNLLHFNHYICNVSRCVFLIKSFINHFNATFVFAQFI